MSYPDFACACEREDDKQKHVHEITGSTEFRDSHNHRFAAVSDEAIRTGQNDHVHEVKFRTDFYEDHFHEFCGRTGGAIPVGGGRHVHFVESVTQMADGHRHAFKAASLIEDPAGKDCK